MSQPKTNAIRMLETSKIPYKLYSYTTTDGKIDGVSVATKINKNPKEVYKTLVAQGTNKEIFVFIIPVESELDLKKAAKVTSVKKIEMVPVKDIQSLTGYIRGGCSPIGMKKQYKTYVDSSANLLETIVISAGKIGLQLELQVSDILTATSAMMVDVRKSE